MVQNKIKRIIRNRPVFILSHGASINRLEDTIEQYKDMDICWVSLGLFTIMEKYILSKINKKLDIVFDCASVPDEFRCNYEIKVRMPRLADFCDRKEDNLWITTYGIIRDSVGPYSPDVLRYHYKTAEVDKLFPKHQIAEWMRVPNSLTLLIAAMLAGGSSKIFIFGMDGYTGPSETGVNTYYHPEEHEKERLVALGKTSDAGISRDTYNFRKEFEVLWRNYQRLFNNNAPIYNVSPITLYKCPPKIKYDQIKGLL